MREGEALIEAIAQRAAAIVLQRQANAAPLPVQAPSPFMTVPEAADFLRAKRQRVDDLLSQRRLTRYKDGSRTLVARAELEAWVRGDDPLLTPRRRSRQNVGVRR